MLAFTGQNSVPKMIVSHPLLRAARCLTPSVLCSESCVFMTFLGEIMSFINCHLCHRLLVLLRSAVTRTDNDIVLDIVSSSSQTRLCSRV